MMRNEELLFCPFCGSFAKESASLHKRDTARVVCTNGDCLVSVDADELWQDFSHAAAKSNTRAQPSVTVKEVADVLRATNKGYHVLTNREAVILAQALFASCIIQPVQKPAVEEVAEVIGGALAANNKPCLVSNSKLAAKALRNAFPQMIRG